MSGGNTLGVRLGVSHFFCRQEPHEAHRVRRARARARTRGHLYRVCERVPTTPRIPVLDTPPAPTRAHAVQVAPTSTQPGAVVRCGSGQAPAAHRSAVRPCGLPSRKPFASARSPRESGASHRRKNISTAGMWRSRADGAPSAFVVREASWACRPRRYR